MGIKTKLGIKAKTSGDQHDDIDNDKYDESYNGSDYDRDEFYDEMIPLTSGIKVAPRTYHGNNRASFHKSAGPPKGLRERARDAAASAVEAAPFLNRVAYTPIK